MPDLLKLALVGGAGYLLYETGILSSITGGLIPPPGAAAATSTPSSATSSPTNPNTATPSNPATPTPSVDTKTLVFNAAQAGIKAGATTDQSGTATQPLLPADDWNYYYSQIRGVSVPSLANYGYTAGKKISIDEWWSYLQSAGLNGLGRLGMLARRGFAGLSCSGACGGCVARGACGGRGGFVAAPALGRWVW